MCSRAWYSTAEACDAQDNTSVDLYLFHVQWSVRWDPCRFNVYMVAQWSVVAACGMKVFTCYADEVIILSICLFTVRPFSLAG